MIPAGFIQELLARTDIAEVVGLHVELKRGGANLMGLCPFHAERSPSFSVSPAKQFFHCFGCGASGDAIRFLTEHLGLSFVEAVRDLAGRVGLAVPEEQVSADERERRDTLRERRRTLAEVLDKAAGFYRQQLKATPRAVAYLKQRGLSGAIAARFSLGFAPPGWKTLAGVFPRYDDPLLEEAGLVRVKAEDSRVDGDSPAAGTDATPDSSSRYDWFRDRVMFPIRAVSGEVIGFGGRVLDDSKPKYMNSPETPIFSKGRELYGLFEARQAIREAGLVLVVEGYMDVVALAQHGHANAVATLGTACTAEHVHKLFRFTDSVVFSFDGDGAGRRAAARAMEAALEHASDKRSVRFLFLPPEHDPDSYVRELGAAAFAQALKQATPLSRFVLDHASVGCELDSAEGRSRFLATVRPLWQQLPEGTLKLQVLADISARGQLDLPSLQSLWGSAAASRSAMAPAEGNGTRAPGRVWPGMAQGGNAPAFRRGRWKPPAALADLALRMLLRNPPWWERLSPDERELLHALEGDHGAAAAWLERETTELGDQLTGAVVAQRLMEEPWGDAALGWLAGAAGDEADFDQLALVGLKLRVAALEAECKRIADSPSIDREALQRLGELRRQIAALKQQSSAAAASGGP